VFSKIGFLTIKVQVHKDDFARSYFCNLLVRQALNRRIGAVNYGAALIPELAPQPPI
jgi:hypothetical protein